MKPYLSKKNQIKLRPINKSKIAYGVLKRHKENHPIRPIISSLNSITSNAEVFLQKILQKFDTTYSLSSSKEFSKSFLEARKNFKKTDKIESFDVKSLYPSVNVYYTIDVIIKEIFKSKKSMKYYFETNLNDEEEITIIPKLIFKQFLKEVLTEFTSFNSLIGFYKQTSGLSMGGKLSSIVSDIYMTAIEKELITPLISKNQIRYYRRYVDDILICSDQKCIKQTFFNLNNFHSNLKFTREEMIDESINFLDCTIYKNHNSGIFEFKNFQKESKSNVLINFKKSISPLKYKMSTLTGEIHRMRHTCSTDEDLKKSLITLKTKFLQNNYPIKIIDEKIKYITDKNFETNNENDYAKQKTDNPDRFHTFITQYSNPQIETITKSLQRAIREISPLFRINFAFQSPKISTLLLHKIKPKIPQFQKAGVVYKFECDCKKSYIGETARILDIRLREHNQPSRKSEVFNHISNCPIYQENLPSNITAKQSTFYHHIKDRFKILKSNLHSYHHRTITESLFINLQNPELNKQNSSCKIHVF